MSVSCEGMFSLIDGINLSLIIPVVVSKNQANRHSRSCLKRDGAGAEFIHGDAEPGPA